MTDSTEGLPLGSGMSRGRGSSAVAPKLEVTSESPNPSNEGSANTTNQQRRKRPSAFGRRRFECDPIPGYHIHVFNEDRVWEMKECGWELCTPEEIHLNQRGIGNPAGLSGNTDLGNAVSVVGNSATNKRGVFMKLKEEWWLEDQLEKQQRNAEIMGAIFPGEPVEPMHPMMLGDRRYIKASFGDQRDGNLGNFRPALLNRGRRYASKPFVPHQPFTPRNG